MFSKLHNKLKILMIILFLLPLPALLAQKNKKAEPSYYVFNEKEEPCKLEEARYIGILEKLEDTVYQWQYYSFSGPLIRVETYKDQEMSIPNGYFAFFDSNGIIDSSGFTFNGRKDKTWFYYSDTLTVWQSEEYNKGVLLKRTNEAELKAQHEDLNPSNALQLDPGEKEATFKGNDNAWRKYLQGNINFPARATSLNKGGTVIVSFVVDKDGSVNDIHIVQSVEYSLDEEALRLIKQSPKWQPALQKGRVVKAYRRQPITFASQ